MILLGTHNNPRAVQGAVDYFKTQGISVSLRSSDGVNVEVWVPEAYQEKAETLWQDFVTNPHDRKYADASWQSGQTNSALIYSGSELNIWQRFSALHWFLKLIFVLCLIVFSSFYLFDANAIFANLQFKPDAPLSWITPALLHFGALHLVFNLSWWLHLGHQIVQRTGARYLFVLFIVSSLVSNWAQFLMVDSRFGGLSGVVYALLGFAWIYSVKHPTQEPIVGKPIVGFMLLWMIFGFTELFFISMANWAHLFGLLSGMLIAFIQPRRKTA
ncbi:MULTISPECIES: rhomboid family intramembrane serine protease GlpG [Pseudoalteromonas]|uniref:Rhomboid family intramembrane serine protease GlpG n=1 Tax=Pseudoalteromonas amylolytica TaxID=1859457 RepID=A0A1S1MXR1_9GAMM|nr:MULTISPECIES: rhomboid family intramembrane serine protease GlpG [Pseudoalteromonas]MCF6435879.1 rhomboid family intramembrane serine protease GlpG [Pseudoalteromonas sp. MMG022]OHU89250.1 rhomboid family intramembrane serine protease GlpG [Pseudoalteromonas sp. JW3]OHU92150.1 rhomboid family intramembrane serine protease GlpG [Pseudoalteromonas amylolytica]